MAKKKQSFFERLTGAINIDDYEDDYELDQEDAEVVPVHREEPRQEPGYIHHAAAEEELEGQLAVDVYDTRNEIMIKSMVAGVRAEDLDITITRDMVTIRGKREGDRTINDEDYYHRELYWGPFSRKILMPEEVDTEESEAVQREGLLIIRLPKVNKNRETKLKVKSNS